MTLVEGEVVRIVGVLCYSQEEYRRNYILFLDQVTLVEGEVMRMVGCSATPRRKAGGTIYYSCIR